MFQYAFLIFLIAPYLGAKAPYAGQWAKPSSLYIAFAIPLRLKRQGSPYITTSSLTPFWEWLSCGCKTSSCINNATASALKSAFALAFALRAIKLALLALFRSANSLIAYIII